MTTGTPAPATEPADNDAEQARAKYVLTFRLRLLYSVGTALALIVMGSTAYNTIPMTTVIMISVTAGALLIADAIYEFMTGRQNEDTSPL